MITFFPSFYEDELVYSLFSRYHAQSGSLAYCYTAEELYKWKYCKPDIEFINQLTDEAYHILTRDMSLETIILAHTMFPYYARFVSKQKRERAFCSMLDMDGSLKNIINLEFRSKEGEGYLRYCPLCAKEDREHYGETYWHRNHQLKGVRVCPKHRCYLQNSSIVLLKKDKPQLTAAEGVVPYDNDCCQCDYEVELQLAQYLIEVFQSGLDIHAEMDIGMYLASRLSEQYVSDLKISRHLTKLHEDYKLFYENIPADRILTLANLQKVFNGKITRFYDICQLAFFEGISSAELLHPTQIQTPTNHIYEKISTTYGYDYQMVSQIGEMVLREYQKENRINQRGGTVSLAWEQMDKDLLPEVKNNCLKIYGDGESRPHRVTILAVQKRLGLPDKRIDKLPLCKQEILKYKESQQEYWAREVVWAYKQLDRKKVPVCWKRIREMTNMRNVDFQSCKQFLRQYTDDDTALAIMSLI